MMKIDKRALILGVGNAQVDAIRYLKERSWWVVGCSYKQEGRGLEFIDEFALVNITDIGALIRLVHIHDVNLVYSIGSDLAMPSIAQVAEKCSLPRFFSYETACLLQNKVQMRKQLAKNQVSPILFRVVGCNDDLHGWESFPAVVKPADSQGQRGVFIANSIQDIRAGLKTSLDFSRNRQVIVEEYLDGPEISANLFVINGRIKVNIISDRETVTGYPGGIPRAHIVPSRVTTEYNSSEISKLLEDCVHIFDLKNGPVYFQIKLTSKGPRIIEITPRLDGCHIWRLIKLVYGFDLLDAAFKMLTGEKVDIVDLKPTYEKAELVFLLNPPGCTFKIADYQIPSDVTYVENYYRENDEIYPVNGILEKVGYYIRGEN